MKNTLTFSHVSLLLQIVTPILLHPRRTYLLGKILFPELRKNINKTVSLKNQKGIKHVLVIRLDEIGDVVLTTPFLRELRKNLPEAKITLIVDKKILNLVDFCPYVDESLAYDNRVVYCYNWQNRRHLSLLIDVYWHSFKFARKHLWQRQFDLVISPRWDIDYYHTAFLSFFSRAKCSVSYSEKVSHAKKKTNRDFDCLYTTTFTKSSVKHEVSYCLDLLQLLGGNIQNQNLELWLHPSDEKFSNELLKTHNTSNNALLFAFGIGAGNKRRKWPPERYIELGEWIQNTFSDARILLVGGNDDMNDAEKIQQHLGEVIINAVNKATLRQTAALLKRSHIYVGSDSGPMHIMAAMKGRIVEISCHPKTGKPDHSNSPIRFGPWRTPSVILQPQLGRDNCREGCLVNEPHCILEISVLQVEKAIKKLLSTNTIL